MVGLNVDFLLEHVSPSHSAGAGTGAAGGGGVASVAASSKSQFQFCERASQVSLLILLSCLLDSLVIVCCSLKTGSTGCRDRGSVADPLPVANFSGTATQWEIFDSYLADFEAQIEGKEGKEKEKVFTAFHFLPF